LVFLYSLLVPQGGAAQATLRGKVVDSEVGNALAGAIVQIQRGPASVTTDTLGQFEAHGIPAGATEIKIRVIGYAEGMFEVRVPDSGMVEGVFPLDFNGYRLPEVVVQARALLLAPRYLDFETRRQRGLGAYLRWDELAKKGYGSIGDALHVVRGVKIHCNQQTFECFAYMARTPQCQPTWWVDGMQVQSFHENTPIRDVYGIEVYRGPGEVPGEFSGSDAACGAIVIWTKSRPYR
jgi:hypothetical protein